jgi:hypothetical protein
MTDVSHDAAASIFSEDKYAVMKMEAATYFLSW